ncbi:PKD domain protein [uncultured archaeon]|nr:PKD domain protein [uncultured archaeon]
MKNKIFGIIVSILLIVPIVPAVVSLKTSPLAPTVLRVHDDSSQVLTLTDNLPPDTPQTPSGRTQGNAGVNYTYTTSTTDPDGDRVYYMWDWGDGNVTGWQGSYASGETVNTTHAWAVKGSYNITVRARDTHRAQSGWSDPLPIVMPYSYQPSRHFLETLFQRFPHAFPILRNLLGY